MFVIPADRFDTSTYSKPAEVPASIFYYENYSGGIGVAREAQRGLAEGTGERHRGRGELPMQYRGCPNCIVPAKSYNISNAEIEKVKGINLGHKLLTIVKNGHDSELRNSQWQRRSD